MALARLSRTVVKNCNFKALQYVQFTRGLQRHVSAFGQTRSNNYCQHTNNMCSHTPHHRMFSHFAKPRNCQLTRILLVTQTALTLPRRSIIDYKVAQSTDAPDYLYIPTPVEMSYDFLEHIHDGTGYPWWLSIIVTTFILRGLLVLPFMMWQQRVLAKIENVQPEINTHAEHMKRQIALEAKERNWSQKQMAKVYSANVKALVKQFHSDNRCESRKIFYVGFMQMGIWTSLTMAIGQMTGKYPEIFHAEPDIDYLPELTTQGALWFTDMTQTGLLIPLMLGVVNLALVEMWSLRRGPLTLLQHRLVNWFRLVSVAMVPIATMMPTVVSFYWLASSLIGLGQFALFRWPACRRFFDIAHSPSEMKHPLEEMKRSFKARYLSKKVF